MVDILTSTGILLDISPDAEFDLTIENPIFSDERISAPWSTDIAFLPTLRNKRAFGYMGALMSAPSVTELADKEFVNSSLATATATFRGTFATLAALEATPADRNDYAFWAHKDETGNTCYDKYTYDGSAWKFEYRLNNSSFTAAQWGVINSGITGALVTKLSGIAEGAQVNVIETVKLGGTALAVSNKAVDITGGGIKSALGISDWALAASKPSYTTAEVTEKTNLYFTDARAKSALTGHTGDTTIHITAAERTAWNAKWDWNEAAVKAVKVNAAGSADKLANSRKLWGNAFNGTADVDGDITLGSGKRIYFGSTLYYIELVNGNIHTNVGLYSDKFISARGVDPDAGGGSGASLPVVWASLQGNTDDYKDKTIHQAHIPTLPVSRIDGLATALAGKQPLITADSKLDYSLLKNTPTIGNGTVTIKQNGTSKGSFSMNQTGGATINLTDTTYSSLSAASGGTAVSLVTTGEKYTWNNKQAAISDLATIRTNAATAFGWGDHSKAGYITGITKAMVESVLTGNITSHTHTFDSLTSKPTTLAGYGIEDWVMKHTGSSPDTFKTAGNYKVETNGTSGNGYNFTYGQVLVLRATTNSNTIAQIAASYDNNNLYFRSGTVYNFTDANHPWRKLYHSGNFIDGTDYISPKTTLVGYGITDASRIFRYMIPASGNKGVRITFTAQEPVKITVSGSNQHAQLVLVGTGYGEGGFIRNNFTELVHSDSGYSWCMPDEARSVEVFSTRTSSDYVTVESPSPVTFTAISALSKTAVNRRLLNSVNYSSYALPLTGGTLNGWLLIDTPTLSIAELTADTTTLDTSWNRAQNVNLLLRSANNAMTISLGGQSNERKGIIQVGHAATTYANVLGDLYLNKFGGKVYIGEKLAYHEGNANKIDVSWSCHTINSLCVSSPYNPVYDANNPDRWVNSNYGSSDKDYSNMPDGWEYGTVLTIGQQSYRGVNGDLNAQFVWDVQHGKAIDNPGRLWWRTKNSSNGWKDWKEIYHAGNCNNLTTDWVCNGLRAAAEVNTQRIEFASIGSSAGHGGFIDFHYNGSTKDYTSRIIEDASGQLTLKADTVNVTGDISTAGWYKATNGLYGTNGVYFSQVGSIGEISIKNNNEFCWGSSDTILHFNFREATNGKTVKNYIWHAGSSTSYATHTMGSLTVLGVIHATTGIYTDGYISARKQDTSSDIRLKTDFRPLDGALEYIKGTHFTRFRWKDGSGECVGIIAQEEQSREYGFLVRSHGEIGHLTYDYAASTALLGAALQEEDDKVEALKRRVKELENKLNKLKQSNYAR